MADYTQTVYDSAAISLGTSTDGAFVDADATNAKITHTPATAGKYRVTVQAVDTLGAKAQKTFTLVVK